MTVSTVTCRTAGSLCGARCDRRGAGRWRERARCAPMRACPRADPPRRGRTSSGRSPSRGGALHEGGAAAARAARPAASQRPDAPAQQHACEVWHGNLFGRAWIFPSVTGSHESARRYPRNVRERVPGLDHRSLESAHSARRTKEGTDEDFRTGTLAGAGSFRCEECEYAVALTSATRYPKSPSCGGDRFRRATCSESTPPPTPSPRGAGPRLARRARDALVFNGDYVAYKSDERAYRYVPSQDGWTRVGRSLSAHVRLDDPTVSADTR